MHSKGNHWLSSIWTAGLLVASSSALATDYYWTGNGQAGLWNDVNNWRLDNQTSPAPACPGAGDSAQFNYESIKSNLTIEITDDITLTGGGVLAIQSKGGSNNSCNVKLKGKITGTGGLVTRGNNQGYVWLTRSDNDYDGPTTMESGRLTIVSVANIGEKSSLGCPTTAENGVITLKNGNQLTFDSTSSATTYKTDRKLVRVTGPAISVSPKVYVEWSGPIEGPLYVRGNYVFSVMNSYSNTVMRTDQGDLHLLGTANDIGEISVAQGKVYAYSLSSNLTKINLGQTGSGSAGEFHYKSDDDYTNDQATVTCYRNGVLANDGKGCLRFTGKLVFNKTNANYSEFKPSGLGTLILDGDIADIAKINKYGNGMTVLNGKIASINTTVVSAGSLYVNGEYCPASISSDSYVNVTGTGILGGSGKIGVPVKFASGTTLAAGASNVATGTLDLTSAPLTLASGAKLLFKLQSGTAYDKIAAGAVTVSGNVTVNVSVPAGVTIPQGTYPLMTFESVTSPAFTLGTGAPAGSRLDVTSKGLFLVVPRSSYDLYTWVGDGADNAWNTTAANFLLGGTATAWTGDGEDVLINDTGSNEPAIDIQSAVAPHLLTVNNKDKNFVIGGAGKLSGEMALAKLGSGTLTLNGQHDYTGPTQIREGVLQLDGTVSGSSITISNGCRLVQSASGVIAGDDLVFKFVDGRQELFGNNTFSGLIVQTGAGKGGSTPAPWLLLGNDNALGRVTEVHITGGGGGNCGIALTNNVTIVGKKLIVGQSSNARVQVQNEGYCSTAWYGDIVSDPTVGTASDLYLTAGNGKVTIGNPDGGNVISGSFGGVSCRGWSGTIDIYSRIDVSASLTRNDMGTVCLKAAGNRIGDSNIAQGTVKMGVTGAWCATAAINLGKAQNGAEATFDLDGFDQTCAGVSAMSTGSGYLKSRNTVKTADKKPATLTCDVADGKTYEFGRANSCECRLNGPLSIVKKGAGTQKFGQQVNMTGSLSVEAGTLEIFASGAFAKASGVNVKGGTLRLTAENAIAPATTKIDLSITGGQVELGANQVVKHLVVNGERMEPGEWGAVGSGAAHESALFTGTGRLTVKSGMGYRIIVR